MHAKPYLLDEDIEMALVNNAIVLRGFVLSARDLQEALRVARKIASEARVVTSWQSKKADANNNSCTTASTIC
jgi:hypothetical protein